MPDRMIAYFLSIVQAVLLWAGLPLMPLGQRLDLGQFALTWSDEFDGGSLDPEKWGGHGFSEGAHQRRDGYWAMEMAQVHDGKLHIPTDYFEEGIAGGPPGFYNVGIDTSRTFRQTYGYFEVRCKLPEGVGLWSAFWMYNEQVGSIDSAGPRGTEIDVFESPYAGDHWWKRNSVSSALHYYDGGYDGTLHSQGLGRYRVKKPYSAFHAYGVEWNADGYIFYIDGKETARSSFGGVCREALYLILSIEIGSWAGDVRSNQAITDFVVDYVRVYQYKSILE